jgi:hypothetical protein
VLARASLGDDSPLAEPTRDESLAERVVDLVGAGVAEVLSFQVDGLPLGEPLGAVERCRAADVVALQPFELEGEAGMVLDLPPAALELVERRDERLGDVAAAVRRRARGRDP